MRWGLPRCDEHDRSPRKEGAGATIKFTIDTALTVPAEKVWTVFAHEFDDAQSWGRICELDQGGIQASEKFLNYNEQEKTCTIRIDFVGAPVFFPVDHNTLFFAVTDMHKSGSRLRRR
jgi:hypothetical protein